MQLSRALSAAGLTIYASYTAVKQRDNFPACSKCPRACVTPNTDVHTFPSNRKAQTISWFKFLPCSNVDSNDSWYRLRSNKLYPAFRLCSNKAHLGSKWAQTGQIRRAHCAQTNLITIQTALKQSTSRFVFNPGPGSIKQMQDPNCIDDSLNRSHL